MTNEPIPDSNCDQPDCCEGGLSRRRFLATSAAAASLPVIAGPFAQKSFAAEGHLVPADKKLSSEWSRSLHERGEPKVWTGDELNTLAMPVGGVGAGQLYVTGDGTLACWWIHNQRSSTGYGRTNYQAKEIPGRRLMQGFAVKATPEGGKAVSRTLDKKGFPNVGFIGRYPINTILYRDDAFPVKIEMEAYSPFIPLNAKDSALPATLLEFNVTNPGSAPVEVALAGWLESPVGVDSAASGVVGRCMQRVVQQIGTRIEYAGTPPAGDGAPPREAITFEDFEGPGYGNWKIEGVMPGKKSGMRVPDGQGQVRGIQGKGFINSYDPDSDAKGKLISPAFTIRRRFINFLLGGGRNEDVYIALRVDGKEVQRRGGRESGRLAWASIDARRWQGKEARLEIVDNATGNWGFICIDQIEFSDTSRTAAGEFEKQADFGTAALALLDSANLATADAGAEIGGPDALWKALGKDAPQSVEYALGETRLGALGQTFKLAPGASRKLRFVVAWHFPIRSWGFPEFGNVGNFYATRFDDAGAVVDFIAKNHARLSGDTHLYRDTFHDKSTLPHWLLERIGHTPSILATGTAHWRGNGRFWGWEGVGCCSGTCTHVWNYEHAMARLFPELERSVREMQDFGVGFSGSGLVSFRGDSYLVPTYAADGQCGTVLKAYREHLMSPDYVFLRNNWERIKRALHYSMSRDANMDGLIEDSQHNTYDINFFGPNPMIGSLYLAALRAGEEMAKIMGDGDFAAQCRKVFESGQKESIKQLWNGEYFIQIVDWKEHPQYQYGDGCLSDQLFGQGWAHQVGLGYIYPTENVKKTMESVYKYNWTPDVGPYNEEYRPERWFAREGDAGLFTCTWPRSEHPDNIEGRRAVRYRNEIWTGIEYQAAGGMIWEGLVDEGLSIIKGVHDRHDGVQHNQYNEVECGDHYARAMAAWGCLLALAGFEYDGPSGRIGFDPKMPGDAFSCFFTGAEGWGILHYKANGGKPSYAIEVVHGTLPVRTMVVPDKGDVRTRGAEAAGVETVDGRKHVSFSKLTLSAGDTLEVSMG